MTAETLKPFITPQSVHNFPSTNSSMTHQQPQRKNNFLSISLSVVAILMAAVCFGFMIWNLMHVSKLETDVANMNRVIESMQKRLGLTYLEDLHDFEKEYTNALIDDDDDEKTKDDDLDDIDDDDNDDENDDDDDEDIEYKDNKGDTLLPDELDYDELVNKYNSYDDDEEDESDDDDDELVNANLSDDDDLYNDFEKYKDSKTKQERSKRSIAQAPNDIIANESEETTSESILKDTVLQLSTPKPQINGLKHLSNKDAYKRQFVRDNADKMRSPLRQRTTRRRKIPMIKSGDTLISAKSTVFNRPKPITPAAHFHLNRKVPSRYAAFNVDSYPGDMYIGHSSWSNELDTDSYFKVENGVLTIIEPGLYYVYAQVCYNNTHDQNGFVIFHGHKPFLQCLNTVPTNMPLKVHTCHTSGLIYLKADETIHLRDFHSDRNVILKDMNNRSYFGLIKI